MRFGDSKKLFEPQEAAVSRMLCCVQAPLDYACGPVGDWTGIANLAAMTDG